MAVIKWQSRKQFLEFTSDSRMDKEQLTMHGWRRRRTLAEQILSTSSKGEKWAALVAQRFNKTTTRQIAGLRAILKLRTEEELYNGSSCADTEIKFDCSGGSYELLRLVFVVFQPESFFKDTVSPVLRDWPTDKPWVIIWLAKAVPNFMRHVDLDLMSRYGRQVLRNATRWTNDWLNALWLILALFMGRVASTEDRISTLFVAKLILHVGMEAFGSQSSDAAADYSESYVESQRKVLYSILSTCLNCGGEESLHSILPSAIILEPFIEACVDALCANGPLSCSALRSLALLKNMSTGMEILLPQQKLTALASCCMNIVLGGGFWDMSAMSEEPISSAALATALDSCPVSLDPSSQAHFKLFDILEPLLWLSNMPTSIPEAHRALVMGGACEFLAKIILDSLQETWLWQDRAIWRIKGEAITCLGNIIEKMDQTELRSRLNEDAIKAIAVIRDNTEAPLVQRDQATFTLRRYKAAAGRCDVEPLFKEALGQEAEHSNREPGQDVRKDSNVDLAGNDGAS
ncbi:hypothetical protein FS837_011739 [Tulasnella sp. UAMH 9824]|nr:hypothetical protein FS837_011739 [Tulasnella sp. UAMH 9824]